MSNASTTKAPANNAPKGPQPRDRSALTTQPIPGQLYRLAWPMVFGIVAMMSVSLVDAYFLGQLGTQPLAAISFTFPVALTIGSLAIGLGAGAASVVSRAIGQGDEKNVKRLATDSLVLATLIVSLVSLIGYFTIEPLFTQLGAQGETLDFIRRYMEIWYIGMPFMVIPMVVNNLLRAAGDSFFPSMIMIIAAVINVILDPLMIFGGFGIAAMGMEGAAWATVISRVLSLVISLWLLVAREHMLVLRLPPWNELMNSWRQVLSVGIPAAAGNMINPLSVGVVTSIVATFGTPFVAAFGVSTQIEAFAAIPMLALSASIGPISGQNWGAGKVERVLEAVKLCFAICLAWSVIVALVLWFSAPFLVTQFSGNETVQSAAISYLRIVPISLFGYGIVICSAAAFNAMGRSVQGLSYYLIRNFALYIPLSWVGAHLFQSEVAVYIGLALANTIGGALIAFIVILKLKRAEAKNA